MSHAGEPRHAFRRVLPVECFPGYCLAKATRPISECTEHDSSRILPFVRPAGYLLDSGERTRVRGKTSL